MTRAAGPITLTFPSPSPGPQPLSAASGRKNYSLLDINISVIYYLCSKSLNICSEWINIKERNKYMQTQWPVNDEPLNTFGTLELLFPISKKEFILVLFQFPKTIILNFVLRSKIHHSCFLLIFKMYCCFIPKWIVRSWCCCITMLCLHTYYLANGILFINQYCQIKTTNNLQRV